MASILYQDWIHMNLAFLLETNLSNTIAGIQLMAVMSPMKDFLKTLLLKTQIMFQLLSPLILPKKLQKSHMTVKMQQLILQTLLILASTVKPQKR